jgi:integrase/recombinase XerC
MELQLLTMQTFNLTHIDNFTNRLAAMGQSPNTVKAYKADLKMLYLTVGEHPLSSNLELTAFETTVANYLTVGRSTWAPSTAKRKLACFRAFGNAAVDALARSGYPIAQGWFLKEYKAPKVPAGVAHPLAGGVDDILKMVKWARRPHHKALVVLCGLLGLRVSEARSVRVSDFDDSSGDIWLTVRGKGDKTRHVPVDGGVMALLDEPLRLAAQHAEGLLIPINDRSARRAWTRIGRRARLDRPTATHDGRMTAGTAFYNTEKDLRAVQELLGHASSATTENYTGVSAASKRKSASIL